MRRRLEGIFNFCNPGAISHNEILDMYKKYIDPDFTYTNFSVEEQDKILIARRSNNELDCTKLVNALPGVEINEIHVCLLPIHAHRAVLLQSSTIGHVLRLILMHVLQVK